MKYKLEQLGSIDIIVIDGDRGKNYPHQNELHDSGHCLFLSARNVTQTGFSFLDNQFITIEKDQQLKNGKLSRGDIVITTRGTVGNVALYSDSVPYEHIRINSGMLIVRCGEGVEQNYLYQVLRCKWFYSQILSIQSGSAQPQLPKSHFLKMFVPLPSILQQRKISTICSSIDKKIELNDAINDNLSAQIETLLLTFLNSEDALPVKLGDYLYIKGRIGWKGLKKNEYLPQSEYRIINGETLTQSGIDWNKAGYISEERYVESPEIMLKVGDILLSKDGTIGKIGYVDSLELPTSVASGIFVIRNTKPDIISTTFIYYLLKSRLFNSFIAARTEGSVIPHLYQKDFMEFEFPLPTPDKMAEFEEVSEPMFSQIINNLNENKRLALLRDGLLPKLMSGEIDVSSVTL